MDESYEWHVGSHDTHFWFWKLYSQGKGQLIDFDFGFKSQEAALTSLDTRLNELGHDRT